MKSFLSKLLPFAAVAVTLVSLSGNARADALPPDACNSVSDVGQTCSNAGTNADEPGVCVAQTCHSASPPDGGSDYACALCEVPDGGFPDAGPTASDAGSTTTDGGGATTVRVDGGTTSSTDSSSGGCSATPDTRDGATGFAMLVVGMISLGLSRRKKKSA
jgi:hypothetical protein